MCCLAKEDSGQRKFILVQLPEKVDLPSFATIADITKERLRRVIKTIEIKRAEDAEKQKGKFDFESADFDDSRNRSLHDLGFRVFKLDQSNFNTWNSNVIQDSKTVERQLELHIDHVRDGRTQEDILYGYSSKADSL